MPPGWETRPRQVEPLLPANVEDAVGDFLKEIYGHYMTVEAVLKANRMHVDSPPIGMTTDEFRLQVQAHLPWQTWMEGLH